MISAWVCKGDIPERAYWERFVGGTVKFPVSPILALDMYKKHSLGSVPGVGLWKEFPIGTISAWILRDRSIREHIGYWFVGGVPVGTISALMCKRNIP